MNQGKVTNLKLDFTKIKYFDLYLQKYRNNKLSKLACMNSTHAGCVRSLTKTDTKDSAFIRFVYPIQQNNKKIRLYRKINFMLFCKYFAYVKEIMVSSLGCFDKLLAAELNCHTLISSSSYKKSI